MKNAKKAFTLVELLVVISIIALLLAILMPALNKVREQGKSLVCKSNLRTMGQISATYVAEYGWYMPGVTPNQTGNVTVPCWTNSMIGYNIKVGGKSGEQFSAKLFHCPSDSSKMIPPGGGMVKADYNKWTVRSYSMNDRYYDNVSTGVTVGGHIPLSAIQRPGETAYIFELWTGITVHDAPFAVFWGPETSSARIPSTTLRNKWCHGKDGNILYFDGHSDRMTLDALAKDCVGFTNYGQYQTAHGGYPSTWCYKKCQINGVWVCGYEGP